MESTEQRSTSSQKTTTKTDDISSPIYKEPHILDLEPHINLATAFDKLEVLYESLVDFENMKRNGIDLTEDLRKQGEAGERLQARQAKEAKERAKREAEEKARLEEEQRAREVAEKVVTEAAVVAEVEAKEKADAEEAAPMAAEEAAKARNDALIQGEQFHSDFSPLVLKTLEELQKE
ncbi:eukaryotic translation initiation factor 4 gamma-like [Lathyrus oleraceus]|uniref:eukaryotic translation initiation factor 4 gamma-like n=1 Tax=Pisum sativum TaxID=3888 RepID=UPI0021D1965E|nr:eukaryotic translation initiation factor 4 gamma-like [Pisum sativum]